MAEDWVELRVHGVSGTPPEDMLDSPHVRQVAGDERSRCFRPLDSREEVIRGPQGQVLEAFHWGRWTSGSWAQALWMLLIPFGIVNAAQFMLPAPTGRISRIAHALSGALLRLLALVLTLAFVVGACVILADLGAWQWLLRRSFPVDDRVVLIAALLAAGAAGYALSLLGRAPGQAAFRFRVAASRTRAATLPRAASWVRLADLESPAFFDGDPDSPALRDLHRAAGLSVVALLGLAVAAQSDDEWARQVRWLPLWLLLAVGAVVLLLGDPERSTTVTRAAPGRAPGVLRRLRHWWHGPFEDVPGTRPRGAAGWVARTLLVAGAAEVVLALVAVGTTEPGRRLGLPPITGTLPGIDGTAAWVGISGTLVVAALFLTVGVLAASTRRSAEPIRAFRRFAGGMTAALAASVGYFLAIGFTAGFSLFAQGALNRLRSNYPKEILDLLPPNAPERIPAVKAPPVLQRVSYAWGITLVLVAAALVAALVWVGVRRAGFRRQAAFAMTFGAEPRPRMPQRWLARVGLAMQLARLKNQIVAAFWYFAVAGVVLSLSAAWAYWHDRHLVCRPALRPAAACYELLTGVSSAPGAPVTGDDVWIGVGSLALVALGTALVTITRGALGTERTRRSLNVVWDVVAFWPRSVHPYVPAPYSQDVVPALVRRICWHLGAPDPFVESGPSDGAPPDGVGRNPSPAGTVVVAAHSQGTLLSLVALLWLPQEVASRVHWLTFGSQLRQQFPRAFPHYVTVDLLRQAQDTHHWLSLYRDTDAIAGPVTSWDHTHDGEGPYRSTRLSDGLRHDDRIDPATGRRECGREWRLLDPAAADPAMQTGAVAAILGHGSYWAAEHDWRAALDAVRSEAVRREPPAVAGVPEGVPGPRPGEQPEPSR